MMDDHDFDFSALAPFYADLYPASQNPQRIFDHAEADIYRADDWCLENFEYDDIQQYDQIFEEGGNYNSSQMQPPVLPDIPNELSHLRQCSRVGQDLPNQLSSDTPLDMSFQHRERDLQNEEPDANLVHESDKENRPSSDKRTIEDENTDLPTKKSKIAERHPVIEHDCTLCPHECCQNFDNSSRVVINGKYWDLSYEGRRNFVAALVKRLEIMRRRGCGDILRRSNYSYHFRAGNGFEFRVCKGFFLTTLGFKKENDYIIREVMKSSDEMSLEPQPDGRGKATDPEKEERHDLIREDIESYHPYVSHYRREHAPNKRYLPDSLTIRGMVLNFSERHPLISCSYSLYCRILKDMNISFAKLGHEECQVCEIISLHRQSHPNGGLDEDCDLCAKWIIHEVKFKNARKGYQEDVKRSISCNKIAYYCVDLQKVIMLPHLDQYKVVIFTQRIVAFNLSFVPLGSINSFRKPIATIWHEAISGRKKEDIISGYYIFLITERDKTHIIMWADNCSSQNKNYAVLTFLVKMVNSDEIAAEKIVIKYFEPGHTFMAADSFHHQVELSMKKMKNIYDFQDFQNAVQQANQGRVIVKSLQANNFYDWPDHSSARKLKQDNRPIMRDIIEVSVSRGSYKVECKVLSEGKVTTCELDFLKKNKMSGIPDPEVRDTNRGVDCKKKQNIIQKLVPLMPKNRQTFWNNLPESNAKDLMTEYDDE